MISRMCFQLKMDRPVVIEGKNAHYISPGGYICGIPFDFFDAEWNRSEEDKSIINVRVRHLDTDIYPEAADLTLDFLKYHDFNEFFIFSGDTDDPEIHPAKVLSLTIEDDEGNFLIADDEKLKNINEVLYD